MSKNKPSQTVSIGALFSAIDAYNEEKRNWHTREALGQREAIAVRARTHDFDEYPFETEDRARAFIEQKCWAAALATLGLKVQALP